MKETRYLLDSMVLIDHLNSVKQAEDFLTGQDGRCSISVITRAEVLTGYGSDQANEITALLDRYPIFGIDAVIADQAAQLRRRFRWKLPDAFQAAIAQFHSLSLATRNTKDFPPARHSFVAVPYRL
jgi:predicted nucleic acid-binding protein